MLLYYITDRTEFPGSETDRRRTLLEKISEAARADVDYIQLREKDLSGRDLEHLAREAERLIRESASHTRLLINSRSDVAIAVAANGVHLRSKDVSPDDVRTIWRSAKISTPPIIAVSCHTASEGSAAEAKGASFIVFGPVFEKAGVPAATGVAQLREVCRTCKIPVLALGGVNLENARDCIQAGAQGIAAIRLFQENDMGKLASKLRQLP